MEDRETLESAMRRALALASRGPAHDANPQVGCVIVDREGRIVAEGWHLGAGTPHAEVDALSRLSSEWAARANELTAVVTLEPCNHVGRTGPCAERLIEAGVGAVVYAIADPSAEAGGGADTLCAAGVEVIDGVLADEARALLAPWLDHQASASRPSTSSGHDPLSSSSTGSGRDPFPELAAARPSSDPFPELVEGSGSRPHVTVKWAQTLDGRAAASDGSSRWITGPEARADVHRRRAEADAILIGTGTLLADDPALTARASGEAGRSAGLLVPAEEQPIPVVLGRRPIPEGAAILHHPALATHGLAEPIRFAGDDLAGHLAELRDRGVERLFVEGGPSVASSFIAAGLADEVLVYAAPALLGGPRLALGDLGIADMSGILRLRVTHLTRLGDDLLIAAAIHDLREEF